MYVQLRFGAPLSDGEVKRIPRLLAAEYPKVKEESDVQFAVKIEGGKSAAPPTPTIVDHGARLLSADGKRMVVTRKGSLVFSHFAPYPGWDDFLAAAKFVVDAVRDKVGYKSVSSVGLRYVNRIDIPIGSSTTPVQPTDYLLVGVALPSNDITSALRVFQNTTEVDVSHDRLVARIQSASAESAVIDHVSLLFDIDVIAQHDVPSKASDFWALVGRMRDAKNVIFESCMTDRARALFGWKPLT